MLGCPGRSGKFSRDIGPPNPRLYQLLQFPALELDGMTHGWRIYGALTTALNATRSLMVTLSLTMMRRQEDGNES